MTIGIDSDSVEIDLRTQQALELTIKLILSIKNFDLEKNIKILSAHRSLSSPWLFNLL